MDFRFDEEQQLLQSTVRHFLDAECTPAVLRVLWESETARSPELWKKLAALGLTGLLIPEAQGGMGLDETAFVLPLEACGHAGLAEPVVATAAVAAPLLREVAGALADEWLPRIATGDARVAVGHPTLSFVEDAHQADLLLLPRGEDEVHALPRSAVQVSEQPANDPSLRIASVAFDASDNSCVARGKKARALFAATLDRGALASAAQALGVCERLLQLAVSYTSERHQFGQAVGSFQAVKHHLANVKLKLEYARPLVQRAAHSVAKASAQRALHVSMAKHAACEAAVFGAKQTLQCHGAIGYTWEQDLHIFMRRAWSLDHAWGSSSFHLERVRRALLEGAFAIGPGATFQEEQQDD